MRFLLNPAQRSVRGIAKKNAGGGKRPRVESSSSSLLPKKELINDDKDSIKSWGQQCSPTCGCVIRFESSIDPSNNSIVGSSYRAKSVVATQTKDGHLEPVVTTRKQKPMFKDCECKTLHTLAKEIVSFLPKHRIDKLKNLTEFTSTRSSPAFRHAVLVENNLPRTDTHCFDVVEEAFTAMVKGNMIKQRRNTKSFHQLLVKEFILNQADSTHDEMPTYQKELGIDRTRLSLSTPRSMSTLRMFDINDNYWESDSQQNLESDDIEYKQQKREALDWVSWVDEMYESEETA